MQKAGKRLKKKWMKVVSVLLALTMIVSSYTPMTAQAAETGGENVLSEAENAIDETAPEAGTGQEDDALPEESEEDGESGAGESATGEEKEDADAKEDGEAVPEEDAEVDEESPAIDEEQSEWGTYAADGELPASGTSAQVEWTIDRNGNLTITGSGNWIQYRPAGAADFFPPWTPYADQIKTATVRIGNGTENDPDHLTSLEAMFINCEKLTSVDFSGTDTRYVTDMSWMLSNCKSLTSITWGTGFRTENVTTMERMFANCESLQAVNVSGFDTGKLQNAKAMFCGCDELASLDVSHFDTSHVTDMEDMFRCCYALTSLTLGTQSDPFVIGSGTNVRQMFYQCKKLTGLDLSQIDTSAATDLSRMFYEWTGAETLDVSVLDTGNVTKMAGMFTSCENLTSLTLGGSFVTDKIEDMSGLFSCCKKLETIDISSFNTGLVKDMNNLFNACEALETLTWGEHFTTGSVENMSHMFCDCKSLTSLDVSKFDTSKVTGMSYMFKGCSALETLKLAPAAGSGQGSTFDTSNVEDMSYMFCNCSALTSLDLGDQFNTGKVTEMYYMFDDCQGLTSLDLGDKFNTGSVYAMSGMFNDCQGLTSLDLGDRFDTSGANYMKRMFQGCWELKTLELGDLFDTGNVTDMEEMFRNCWALEALDLGEMFDTSKVTNMSGMFQTCTGLKKLTLGSKFNTSKVEDMESMFYRCDILTTLDLSSFDASKVTKAGYMLDGNHQLTLIKCPRNLTQDVTLPKRSDSNEGIYWMDENEVEYTSLPKNLTESITLVRSDRVEEEEPTEEETEGSAVRLQSSCFKVTYEESVPALAGEPDTKTVNRYFRTYVGVANYIKNIEKDKEPSAGETGTYDYTITYLKESTGHDLYFEDGDRYIKDENKEWRFEYRAIQKAKSITYDYEKKNGNSVCFACTMDTRIPLVMKFDNVFFNQPNYSDHKNEVMHKLGKVTYDPRNAGYDYRVDFDLDSNMEIDELTICGSKELWIDAEPTIKIGKLHMGSGRIVVTDIWRSEDGDHTIDRDRLGTRTIDEITTEIGMQYIAVGMPGELKDGESVDCFKTRTNPEDINLKLRDADENEYARIAESTETVDGSEVTYYTMTVFRGKETGGKDNYQYKVIYDGSADKVLPTWAEVLTDINENAGGKDVTVRPVKNEYLWSANTDWDWKEALDGFPTGIGTLTLDFMVGGGVSIKRIGSDKVSYPVTFRGDIDLLYDENAGASRAFSALTVEGYDTSLRLHCNLTADTLIVKNDIEIDLYASGREMEDGIPTGDAYGRLTAGTLDCSRTPAGKLKLQLAGFGYKAGDAILTTGNELTADMYEYSQNEYDETQFDVKAEHAGETYSLVLDACYLVKFEDPNHRVATPPSQRIKAGGKVAKVSDPVLDGWVFKGWYKETAFRTLWDFDNDTVDKNMTLYAKLVKDGSSEPDPDPEPDDFVIEAIEDQIYTGAAIKPVVMVYDGDTLLTEKVDYTIAYKNNTKANDASVERTAPTVTITGKGNYGGKKTATFCILQKDLTDADVEIDPLLAAEGKNVQKPVPVIRYNGKALKNKTDFIVSYPDLDADPPVQDAYKKEGTYTVRIQGTGNFTGETDLTFTITKLTLISKVKIASVPNQRYTGSDVEPELTITYKGETLQAGTDYSVDYEDNMQQGKAKAIVTGTGKYMGSRVVYFNITGDPIFSKATVENITDKVVYNGQPQTQAVTVKLPNGTELQEDIDYTVTYDKNRNVGKAAMTLKGINQYSGTIRKSFSITAYNIEENMDGLFAYSLQESPTDVAYAKNGSTPGVNVTFDSEDMVLKKDFNISYGNNKKVTLDTDKNKPFVKITGKGNFKGNVVIPFTIVKKDIEDVDISVADVGFVDKKGKYVSKPVVTDTNGKTMKEGTDYTVKYKLGSEELTGQSIVPKGSTVTVVVTGKGNYDGETSDNSYRVAPKSFSTVKITVADQIYTGSDIELTESDITIKAGNTPLDYGYDYEIAGYRNNRAKGTAYVTLKGVNEYGGSKTVKFKIKVKEMKK